MSKNTSNSNSEYGLQLERQAFAFLRSKFQTKLLQHRYKTPFGEVDLLLKLPSGEILMVEVKSLASPEHLATRIGKKQLQRLKNVFVWLNERQTPVYFWAVFIDSNGHVLILDDIFG